MQIQMWNEPLGLNKFGGVFEQLKSAEVVVVVVDFAVGGKL